MPAWSHGCYFARSLSEKRKAKTELKKLDILRKRGLFINLTLIFCFTSLQLQRSVERLRNVVLKVMILILCNKLFRNQKKVQTQCQTCTSFRGDLIIATYSFKLVTNVKPRTTTQLYLYDCNTISGNREKFAVF